MNVLLINPPKKNEIFGNNPALIEEERGVNPPLGLLYLAGYLERKSTHRVSVLDAQVEKLDYEGLRARLQGMEFDVVGITAMTMTMVDVLKSIAMVKELAPETIVVLGGPHVNLYPRETLQLPQVDYVVMGEGEIALSELLDRIEQGNSPGGIPGVGYKSDGDIVAPSQPRFIDDLDALPLPARHLTPYRGYNSLLSVNDVVTTLFTSRGCPFGCRFCDRPQMGRKFRARSADSVLTEIVACVDLGIQEFLIYDDTFTINRQRVLDICSKITEAGLKIGFDIRARVDTVDREMLRSLKKAGCQGIHYGVEAGTPKVLKTLRKGITLEQAQHAFDLTKQTGIPTLSYFMIGSPGETREDILATFRTIRDLNPDYLHMTILTPFPGTEIYAEALQRGVIKSDVWQEFAAAPRNGFQPPHWGEYFTREELNDLLVQGYKSFYLRPGYVLKRLIKVRGVSELMRKAKAGMAVLRMKS
jgi:radical SAM superfamily enzyme YgiQ (UPF0313 family)